MQGRTILSARLHRSKNGPLGRGGRVLYALNNPVSQS